jgi:hypothetical protein
LAGDFHVFKGKTGAGSDTIGATSVTSFRECTAFGVTTAVVETCGTEKDSIVATSTAAVSVIIGAGCKIVMKMTTCSMTIAGKQALAATWTNPTGGKGAQMDLSKVPFVMTSTGGICGESGTGTLSATFDVSLTSIKLK